MKTNLMCCVATMMAASCMSILTLNAEETDAETTPAVVEASCTANPSPTTDVASTEAPATEAPVTEAVPEEKQVTTKNTSPKTETSETAEQATKACAPATDATHELDKFALDLERLQERLNKKLFPVKLVSNRSVYRYVDAKTFDNVYIKLESSQDAYVYIFVLNANGEFSMLYPNKLNSDSAQNEIVEAGKKLYIPDPKSNFKFGISTPVGEEIIVAVCKSCKFDFDNPSYRHELQPVLEAVKAAKSGAEKIKAFSKAIIAYVEDAPMDMGVQAIKVESVQVDSLD